MTLKRPVHKHSMKGLVTLLALAAVAAALPVNEVPAHGKNANKHIKRCKETQVQTVKQKKTNRKRNESGLIFDVHRRRDAAPYRVWTRCAPLDD